MKRNIGITVLQIALAFFLLVSGITGLLQSSAGTLNPVIGFLNSVIQSATVVKLIIISIAVSEIIAGAFLLVGLFTLPPVLINTILIIFIVLWIVNIILVDFIGVFNSGLHSFDAVLVYLQQLSAHLMVLGALMLVRKH